MRLPLATAVGLLLASTLAGGALASSATLDQEQTTASPGKYWDASWMLAQTFESQVSGSLDTVDVNVSMGVFRPKVVPAIAWSFSLGVFATDAGGFPTGSSLAEGGATPSADGWIAIDFATPATVTAGTTYALVLQATSGFSVDWRGNCDADAYANGSAQIQFSLDPGWSTMADWQAASEDPSACQSDFAFREYVIAAPAADPPSAPPTSTVDDRPTGSGSSLPIGLIALFSAAAFAGVYRLQTIRRR